MSHPDRRPQIRAFVLAATALLGGLAAGIWANLLTGVESPEPWAFLWALRALEWSNLYLAAAIGPTPYLFGRMRLVATAC